MFGNEYAVELFRIIDLVMDCDSEKGNRFR